MRYRLINSRIIGVLAAVLAVGPVVSADVTPPRGPAAASAVAAAVPPVVRWCR